MKKRMDKIGPYNKIFEFLKIICVFKLKIWYIDSQS